MDGDESALAVLYDRYSGLVFSVAKRILGDRGAAEEILQDILYQVWRTASRFDLTQGSLAGWLLVAARNRAIDRLRRRQGARSDPMQEDMVALAFNLESAAEQDAMLSKVRKLLEELPEAQRTALELAYFEGLTHSEIAQRTGEPLGTVKSRLRTALGSLKKALHP
jgi:RNA polymerase sigma-70 factor (ECF subfamily)